jgi:hypothetical protein
MYKLIKPMYESQTTQVVQRLSDNAFIPFDPTNMDFVEYQKWLLEGNTPLPAEETL